MYKLIAALFCIPACLFPAAWMIDQINEDLGAVNPSDLTSEAFDQAMQQKYLYDPGLVRYKIQDGKLFVLEASPKALRKGETLTSDLTVMDSALGSGFSIFTYNLKKIVEKYSTPDCEFILCLRDGPNESVNIPVLRFSKLKNYPAILVPDPDSLGKGKLYKIQAGTGSKMYPWGQKIHKAFWRGQSTGILFLTSDNYRQLPRFQLVEQSLKYPEWVDARFTHLSQGAEQLKEIFSPYMGASSRIPEHLKYKYQILVDGNTCAWSRAYWQLFSNSVIIKQDSDYIQWYYKGLQPYMHYIPVASDFHNLIDQLEWAQNHDQEAFQISLNAQEFANDNLNHEQMLYYIYLLLSQYSKIQKGS